jgi:hypothetical protein
MARQAEKKFKEYVAKSENDMREWAAYLCHVGNDEKDSTMQAIMHQEQQRLTGAIIIDRFMDRSMKFVHTNQASDKLVCVGFRRYGAGAFAIHRSVGRSDWWTV